MEVLFCFKYDSYAYVDLSAELCFNICYSFIAVKKYPFLESKVHQNNTNNVVTHTFLNCSLTSFPFVSLHSNLWQFCMKL